MATVGCICCIILYRHRRSQGRSFRYCRRLSVGESCTPYNKDHQADSHPERDIKLSGRDPLPAAHERLRRQLQAKEAQITSRTELYEDQVDRLWQEIDRQCDELEALANKMCRTDEDEEWVAEKFSHLYGELRETRQRFHRELRELEDERIALQQELDALDDGQDLVALADDWL